MDDKTMLKNILVKMRLHHKLMLSMLLLGLVPLVLFATITILLGENVLIKHISEEHRAVAEDKAKVIEKSFYNNIREISLLAKHPLIIDALKQEVLRKQAQGDSLVENIQRIDRDWIKNKGKTEPARLILNNTLSVFLKAYQDREPEHYGEIFVTDKYGAAIGMTKPLTDYYQADEQWWRGAYNNGKGDVFIDDRGFDRSAMAVVVGIVVPVLDAKTVIGVLKINFKLSETLHSTRLFRSKNDGHTLIARHDGYILVNSNDITHEQTAMFEEHRLARSQGVIEKSEQGKDVLAAHAIVNTPFPIMSRLVGADGVKSEHWKPTQWHVVLHADKDEAYLPINQLYYWSVMVAALVIFVVWAIGLRLSRVLSEPMDRLHAGIVNVANGDLKYRVDINAGGEIGELAKTFDSMTENLMRTTTTRDELKKEIDWRKRIETDLRNSEQRFRGAFEQAAVGIAHVGLDGNWQLVNERLCDITGYRKEELLQKTFHDITHPEDTDIDKVKLKQLLKGEIENYDVEKRYIRKDGTVVWINLTVALAQKMDGSPDYFISVIEDINEKRSMKESLYKLNKELEQRVSERTRELSISNLKLESTLKKLYKTESQMLQAEKMAAMGTFAAGIAHELNNPLTGILNYVQYTRDKVDDETLKGYLDKAEKNTLRAAKVIENMLAYSRQSQPEEAEINISTVIERAIDIMRPELNRAHIEIDLELEHELPLVRANADTLEQVFINLMGNARDAMEEQVDKRISIHSHQDTNNINVTIRDTGGGINEDVGDKIFDPFFTTKPPGKGTGLGLGLCQRIITNLGGIISYDSEVGKGTTFYIHIPIDNLTKVEN